MNIGNILKVADAIEQASVPGLGFNMGNWRSNRLADRSQKKCGTTACICGWAAVLENRTDLDDNTYAPFGMNYFGLDERMADRLFLFFDTDADAITKNREAVTPAQAVRALRILAITGKVDWDAAMKGDEPVLPPLRTSKALVRTA